LPRGLLCVPFPLTTMPRPPTPTLFPYTTLFRSGRGQHHASPESNEGFPGPSTALLVDLDETGTELSRETIPLGSLPQAIQHRERSEEHTSELQSREISYAVFCLKKKRIRGQLLT